MATEQTPEVPVEEMATLAVAEPQVAEEKKITLRERTNIATLLKDPLSFVGKKIGVAGWIRTCRNQKQFAFVKVYDGTVADDFQIICKGECPGFEHIQKACTGAAVFVIGKVLESPGKGQPIEVVAEDFQLLGACDNDKYPLAKKAHSLEYLRSIGHLRPRTMAIGSATRIRNCLAYGTHQFFQGRGFQYVHTPLLTASDCEGGGEMFQVTTLVNDEGTDFRHKTKEGKPDWNKDFFKTKSFLTVSGQLNAEIYATALSSVYTFGPTFRAENSQTSRHLAEFWMIEPEIAFADIFENMDICEAYIKFMIRSCLENCPSDMAFLEKFEKQQLELSKQEEKKRLKAEKMKQAEIMKAKKKAEKEAAAKRAAEIEQLIAEGKEVPVEEPKVKAPKPKKKKGGKKRGGEWRSIPLRERLQFVVDSEFARITYTEAIETLIKAVEGGHEFDNAVEWGIDLASEHERYLCEEVYKRPTIVRDYPKNIKAFYMRMNDDNKTVAAMDILVPGVGELVGGSQREERLENLLTRCKEMDLDPEDYSWYVDLRRYGSVPHSGFGIGFERMVCYTTGMENIRDAIPFPRYPGHCNY